MVERQLPKLNVAGSIPVTRFAEVLVDATLALGSRLLQPDRACNTPGAQGPLGVGPQGLTPTFDRLTASYWSIYLAASLLQAATPPAARPNPADA